MKNDIYFRIISIAAAVFALSYFISNVVLPIEKRVRTEACIDYLTTALKEKDAALTTERADDFWNICSKIGRFGDYRD